MRSKTILFTSQGKQGNNKAVTGLEIWVIIRVFKWLWNLLDDSWTLFQGRATLNITLAEGKNVAIYCVRSTCFLM